jgi:hypothetical protein
MKVHVGNAKLGAIKAVVRAKCGCINRPQLMDVNGSEIKVLTCQSEEVYICRIRGMTYTIGLDMKHPSLAVFDPVMTSGQKVPFRRGRSGQREKSD